MKRYREGIAQANHNIVVLEAKMVALTKLVGEWK